MAGLQIRFIGLIVVISLLIAGGTFLAKQFLPKGNSSKSTQQTNQLDQANNQASAGNNKDVKIQGARNIAKAALTAYSLTPTKASKKKLLSLRPTEPMMKNVLQMADKLPKKKILEHFDAAQEKINKYAF